MSVPADMMARMGQKPPPPLPGGGTAGPAGTPMASPTNQEGSKTIARVKVHVAMNMLEAALGDFGSETDEGKVILKNLTTLANTFGDRDDSDLAPAELMQMFKSMPQVGGGNDMQKKIAEMMKGGGAGAPGAPGGAQGGMQPPQMPQPPM